MKVLIGKNSGFCFGVSRAVEKAERIAASGTKAYTCGKIIHNDYVVDQLAEKGVRPLEDLSLLQPGDTLILRAHGTAPEIEQACRERGVIIEDATCPFVKRIHQIAAGASSEGRRVFIAGHTRHPEVVGICGYAVNAVVVENADAVSSLATLPEKGCLVSQTTFVREDFLKIRDALSKRIPDLTVFDTICDTTSKRQQETEILSRICTKMIVIGSEDSANTRRLYEIAGKHCKNTEMIGDCDVFFLANLQSDDIIGVVAGASTPERMIREVLQRMSELEKTTIEAVEAEAVAAAEEPAVTEEVVAAEEPKTEAAEVAAAAEQDDETSDFAEAFEKTMTRIRNGQLITGAVLEIRDGEVYVNVGYKTDGVIPKGEYSADPDADPSAELKVGDSIEVEVVKVSNGEGNVLLSRKTVESKKIWDDLMAEAENTDKVFEAVGKQVIKGGIIADMSGISAFVPASQVSTKYIENLNEFVGKPMKLKVLEVDKQRKRIVASQKVVLLEEAKAAKKAKWDAIQKDTNVKGIVRRITDFGAFVDIGGVDGLVHVTDAAWGRVKHPSDVFTIGQEIEVRILNVDAEKERISLGYKQLQPKPWTVADQKYPVGTIVEGKVVRIVPFGAFVALEPTIDGLIHISQVGVRRIAKVEDEINVGDVVRCKVLEVNIDDRRISLSRREAILEEQPEVAAQLKAEKEERDRQHQERQEQRQQREAQPQQRRERPERSASSDNGEQRRERSNDRRRHNSEDGDYELPPVTSTTTSLADLFSAFKTEE